MGYRFLNNLFLLSPVAVLILGTAASQGNRIQRQNKKLKQTSTTTSITDSFNKDVLPLIKTYCGSCHGDRGGSAGLSLLRFHSSGDVLKSRSEWQKVSQNIETAHMPPEGNPLPTKEQREMLVGWIDGTLSKGACDIHDPGHVTMRRLNREEYNNTIRDLTGLDLKLADTFPNDDVGYGFDNIGDVLSMSPLLMEKYMAAAEKIAHTAVVTPEMLRQPQDISLSKMETTNSGSANSEGILLPTTGSEAAVTQNFSEPGDYILRVKTYGQQAGSESAKMIFKLDGNINSSVEVPDTAKSPGTYEFSIKVSQGKHRLSLSFANDFYNPGDKTKGVAPQDRNLILTQVELTRPEGAAATLPVTNRRIITVSPNSPQDFERCTRKVLGDFARRAYRHPITASDLDRIIRVVKITSTAGESWERKIQLGIQAILVSPNFLFRVESDPNPSDAVHAHVVGSYELTSRLSYFLWSSMPDDTLMKLAANNTIQQPVVIAAQAKRMLRDPKAHALADSFAGQWLQLRNLANVSPDTSKFPNFNSKLRQSMQTETEMFFESVVKDDRSILDFLNARYTYINEPLAKLYGISGVTGDNFRRIDLTGDQRGGLLTQASVLTVTSNPTRTSPVKRGKWVLSNFFNQTPPPPPPNVPVLADDKKGPLEGTLRQRMEAHRKNPICASCHARMDPIGFGLENYDGMGAWRTMDGKYPVDSSGTMNGQKFTTPGQLKNILLENKKQFTRCLTEKMFTYALGRGITSNDKCNIDAMSASVAKNDYRFSALVTAVVQSNAFKMRRGEGGIH